MEVFASTTGAKISPRKARLIADSIRKKSVADALRILTMADKRAAYHVMKTLKSAVSNAVNNAKLNDMNLTIKSIDILEGASLKRYHPSSRGRVHPYKKRSSHIKITLFGKEQKDGAKS